MYQWTIEIDIFLCNTDKIEACESPYEIFENRPKIYSCYVELYNCSFYAIRIDLHVFRWSIIFRNLIIFIFFYKYPFLMHNFSKYSTPLSWYIYIFRVYLFIFFIFKHTFIKPIHHIFHCSVRKRSADALNRVRSQAKLKDATKRIGFLSRYKLLYHSHFLKLCHQKLYTSGIIFYSKFLSKL